MSFQLTDWYKVVQIKEDTRQTVSQLNLLNNKMDRQIKLMEQMVAILTKIEERRTDADY